MPIILSGRYRLDQRIGGGGMGEVWQAHDNVLERDVAVKVIRSELADSATVRARLRVEAQLAGSLHHPGIVDVFDYGEHEADGRTVPYLVMPLVDGHPLSNLLDTSGALDPGQTMAIVAGVADALQISHTAGIVHRDLKPGNILLTRSGRVMLVDFGIARAADGEPLTETGALLGTVDYLSPEQCAGRAATPASDLYGLGVVAYACLSGTLPFHRERDIATALAHIQEPMPPLPADLPGPLRDLVARMLAKEPSQRPADAAEVARLAHTLASSLPSLTSLDEQQSSMLTAQPVKEPQPTAAIAGEGRARRPRRMAVMGVGAIVIAGAAFAVLATRGPDLVNVPTVRGDTVSAASAELGSHDLRVRTKDVDVANQARGTVVRQSPSAGTSVAPDSVVTISVATGRVRVPVDDLIGAGYASAAARLDDLGLVASQVLATSTKPAGTVIAVDPGGRIASGGTVQLTVAQAAVPATPSTGSGTKGSGNSGKSKGKSKKPK